MVAAGVLVIVAPILKPRPVRAGQPPDGSVGPALAGLTGLVLAFAELVAQWTLFVRTLGGLSENTQLRVVGIALVVFGVAVLVLASWV